MSKIIFFLLSVCVFAYSVPNGLMTAPRQFPQSYTSGVYGNVCSSYNPKDNTVFFSWSNISSVWFAIYDFSSNSFTTPPTLVDATYMAEGGSSDTFNSYNSHDNTVFLSWADNSPALNPWFAIYDFSSRSFTTSPTLINAGYTAGAEGLFSSYNSRDNTAFISWSDNSLAGNPWFAIYDFSSNSFTKPPTLIDPTYTNGSATNIINSYNSRDNTVFISWPDNNLNPTFTIYDCSSKSFLMPPTLVNANYIIGAHSDIYNFYNSKNNVTLLSWADNSTSQNPTFTIYDFSSNSFTILPTLINASYTAQASAIFSCYNTRDNTGFFSWSDRSSLKNPWFAIYSFSSGSFVIPPTLVNANYTTNVEDNIFNSYNSRDNLVVLSWADLNSPHNPWLSIYYFNINQALLEQMNKFRSVSYQKGL